jgi:hypothetical protein
MDHATKAEIVPGATGATLSLDGQTLQVIAECNHELRVTWESAEEPLRPEDISYPGVKRLIIEPSTRTGNLDLKVRLVPGK